MQNSVSNVHEEPSIPQPQPRPVATTTDAAVPTTNYGLTDDEFKKWLTIELQNVPNRNLYNQSYNDSIDAIIKWRQRYRGNPHVWKRVFKKTLW